MALGPAVRFAAGPIEDAGGGIEFLGASVVGHERFSCRWLSSQTDSIKATQAIIWATISGAIRSVGFFFRANHAKELIIMFCL